MAKSEATFENSNYKWGFIFWSAVIVAGYFLLSYNVSLAPYGQTDEETDYFMNAALVAAGQKPFVILHPGAWVQQLGGAIQYLMGLSITEDQQFFLNIARIIPYIALLLSMYYFYRSFYKNIGFLGVSSAFALLLSWPSMQQYTAIFCASAFIVSLSLFLVSYLFNLLHSSKQLLSHYIFFGLLCGFALNTKFTLLVFLASLFLVIAIIKYNQEGFRRAVFITFIVGVSLLAGYTIAFIPNIEISYYPFINLLRNILFHASALQGNGITGKLTQLYYYSPLLIAPYTISIIFLLYILMRYKKELLNTSRIDLCMIGLLILALIIAGKQSYMLKIITNYRHLLPYAAIWPLLVIIIWPYLKQYSKYAPKIITVLAILFLVNSSYQFNAMQNASRQNQIAQAKTIAKGLKKNGITPQHKIAGTRIFSDHWRSVMIINSVQNGGSYFTPTLIQGTPSETLFFPDKLPNISLNNEKKLKEFIDRLSNIACEGKTELIKVRKNIFTEAVSFVGKSLGKNCNPILEYIALDKFEKRGQYKLGVFAGYSPEEVPDVIIYDIISEKKDKEIYTEISRIYKIKKSVPTKFGKRSLRIIWLNRI